MANGLVDEILEHLIEIYLLAEKDLVRTVEYKQSYGYVDYGEISALNRVQEILQNLVDSSWIYAPQLVEQAFYVSHPEKRIVKEPIHKHIAGYNSAAKMTITEHAVIDRLVNNLMGELTEAAAMAKRTIGEAIILGRQENDIFRELGLSETTRMEAAEFGIGKGAAAMVERMKQEGITAFVDKAGRRWSLHTYANMAVRTTARQAEFLSVLFADFGHDLYQISSHGTTCPLCAPFEGRVYSRDGTNPDYPPLSAAFGKIDKYGAETLENTYLNIHPNCLHVITRYSTAGKTEKEINHDKDFSSFRKNPPDVDPRSKKQIDAYRQKETGRRKYLEAIRQHRRYMEALGDGITNNPQTFLKHKVANDGKGDEKYHEWVKKYREHGLNAKLKGDILTKGSGAGGKYDDSWARLPEFLNTIDFSHKKGVCKLLDAFEKQAIHLNYETDMTVTSDGKVWITRGTAANVHPELIESIDGGSSLVGSYSYHNHPKEQTYYSFSAQDIGSFFEYGANYAKASDYKYVYEMRRKRGTAQVNYDEICRLFEEYRKTEVYRMSDDEKIDIDEDGFHEVVKYLSKKFKFFYRRYLR